MISLLSDSSESKDRLPEINIKIDGSNPVDVFLLGVFKHIQKCFVFLIAFGTHIKMFADERHEFFRVMRLDFGFNKFVQTNEHFITGHFLGTYIFQNSKELDNDLILKFGLWFEYILNTLKYVFNIHTEKLTINLILILLIFKSHQQILRSEVFEGQALFQPQAGIVQEFVQCVAVGFHSFGGFIHGYIL